MAVQTDSYLFSGICCTVVDCCYVLYFIVQSVPIPNVNTVVSRYFSNLILLYRLFLVDQTHVGVKQIEIELAMW